METLASIQEFTESVEGFLSQDGEKLFEGELLYRLAKRARGPIVEIGSWQGKSTIWLAKGSEAGHQQRVYAVDPHTGSIEHRLEGPVWTLDRFKENLRRAQVEKWVIPVVAESVAAAPTLPNGIALLFIDGAHDFASVETDLKSWLPKLAFSATIAFHDTFTKCWPDVRRFVHKEIFKSLGFKEVRYINGITYAIRVECTTYWERLINRKALLIKQLHEKSLTMPQPFKSLIKRLIWRPQQNRWRRELEK